MTPLFRDRRDAGRILAQRLTHYAPNPDLRVLALPRGGVPVAFEIAQALHAPLDVLVVRKLGVPGHEELAMGALTGDGTIVLDRATMLAFGVSLSQAQAVIEREGHELARREREYRYGEQPLDVQGRTIIVVDDGVATGATMQAALTALKQRMPRALVVATPVASAEACDALRRQADDVVCARTPRDFMAVGAFYKSFAQTTDDEVRALLSSARQGAFISADTGAVRTPTEPLVRNR